MTVPDRWRTMTLADIAQPITDREVPEVGTPLPFIGMEHVEPQTGHIRGMGSGTSVRSSSPKVQRGDVLYGRLRPYLNKVTQAPTEAYASGEFIVFRGHPGLDARFLRWRLSSEDFVRFACSLNTGDRPRVKWSQMREFRLVLPPVDEQRRIVEILEDQLSRLDAADEGLRTARRRLGVLRGVAFSGLMTKARESQGSTAALLGDLAEVGTGTTPSRGNKAFYDAGTVPWITSGDLHQGVVTDVKQYVSHKALRETSLRMYPKGTLLVAMYGEGRTRGTCAELGLDATVNQACAAIQVRDPSVKSWVRAVLDAQYVGMRAMAAGGVQPNLNLGLVRSIQVPMPDGDTRERLLRELAATLDACSRLDLAVEAVRSRAVKLRQGLLAAAFRGLLTERHTAVEIVEELAHAQSPFYDEHVGDQREKTAPLDPIDENPVMTR